MKYTESILIECIKKDNATLDPTNKIDKFNSRTKVKFTCQCGRIHTKSFPALLNGGAKCDGCTRKKNDNYIYHEYTETTLINQINNDGAILDPNADIKKLNTKTKIKFTCKCSTDHIKSFTSILNGGAKCDSCTRNTANIKIREKKQEYFGDKGCFVYNSQNLLRLIKEANATLKSEIDKYPSQTMKVIFICSCGTKCKKNFMALREKGAYCIKCLIKGEIAIKNKEKREEKHKLIEQNNPGMRKCRNCKSLQSLQNYKFVNKNRARICNSCKNKNLKREDNLSDQILKLKREKGPCVDCGETNVKLLQFDHINREEKIKGVTALSNIKTIKAEIAKCEMRCIICHTRKTKEQLNWKQKPNDKQDYIDEIKRNIGGCQLCDWYDEELIEALHFDHLDRKTKIETISRMGCLTKYTKDDIDKEIAKCRLICAHCHRLHTIKQLGFLDNTKMTKSKARELRNNKNKDATEI